MLQALEEEQALRARRTSEDMRVFRWFSCLHLGLCAFHLAGAAALCIVELATSARPCAFVRTWAVLYMAFVPLYLVIQLAGHAIHVSPSSHVHPLLCFQYILSAANGIAYVLQIVGLLLAIVVVLASSRAYRIPRTRIVCQDTNPPLFYTVTAIAIGGSLFLLLVGGTGLFFFYLVLKRSNEDTRRRNAMFPSLRTPNPGGDGGDGGDGGGDDGGDDDASDDELDADPDAGWVQRDVLASYSGPMAVPRHFIHSHLPITSAPDGEMVESEAWSEEDCALCSSSLSRPPPYASPLPATPATNDTDDGRGSSDIDSSASDADPVVASSGFEVVRIRVLPCTHAFHVDCIDFHFISSRLCPTCDRNVILLAAQSS